MKRILLLVLFLLLTIAVTLAVRSRQGRAAADPSSILFFRATPEVVSRGEPVTLDWETLGVNSVALEWGPADNPWGNMRKRDGLPPMGTLTVQPQEDTIYVLECDTNPEPLCTESVTVRVH